MRIYVYNNSLWECEYPIMSYMADCVPRVNELLHFAHYGGFKVNDVVYRISDDCGNKVLDCNDKIMWVELYVEKFKGESNEESNN